MSNTKPGMAVGACDPNTQGGGTSHLLQPSKFKRGQPEIYGAGGARNHSAALQFQHLGSRSQGRKMSS